ncbi:hypothetical protein CLOSBL3_20545 [Clostridiaceae bacterium BL-3]|nr:hypothetical protein CLOSBL3_20545 [Clostridiaceae bacterium BL-3]
MLRFNCSPCYLISDIDFNLNTSHVKVQPGMLEVNSQQVYNLNTSHVKVQHSGTYRNTST